MASPCLCWYDPAIGRFLSPDPSGSGDNPYAYCGNNPVSSLDPLGLDPGNVNPSPSSGDSQDLSGLFQAGASWVGKGLSYLGRQLFGSGTGDFHTSQFAQNAVSALRYHFGNTSSTFDHYLSAPTYGLPYLSILQGDPYGSFLTQAVPIAGQAALALATDGMSAAGEIPLITVIGREHDIEFWSGSLGFDTWIDSGLPVYDEIHCGARTKRGFSGGSIAAIHFILPHQKAS